MLNKVRRLSAAVLFFLFIVPLQAVCAAEGAGGLDVRHPAAVDEGSPFVLRVSGAAPLEELEVLWLGKVVPLRGQGGAAELLLSVPLDGAEKSRQLLIRSTQGVSVYSGLVEVRGKDFPLQKLNVDARYVTPPESVLARIKREAEKNRAFYATITPQRYWSLPLQRPLPGDISSEFGLRRVFNDEPRGRHRGVDFRGAEGTPIHSLAAGRVVLAEEQYYSGNVVIVDHGLGVYSNYCHMSAFKVQAGEMVEAGQILGLVGMTGRVTGPHLHLGFVVLGEAATPEPLMPDFRRR